MISLMPDLKKATTGFGSLVKIRGVLPSLKGRYSS